MDNYKKQAEHAVKDLHGLTDISTIDCKELLIEAALVMMSNQYGLSADQAKEELVAIAYGMIEERK